MAWAAFAEVVRFSDPAMLATREKKKSLSRPDSRRDQLLDTAAALFCEYGYDATSLRDIAERVGMQAGSTYCHFRSKEDLLVAVYIEGVRRITHEVLTAIKREKDPWRRLEAACVAHLETLLGGGHYAQVVIRVLPHPSSPAFPRLVALRDGYERIFRELIEALSLPSHANRKYLRLLLVGALNWSPTWYRPGADSPSTIAETFLRLLRDRVQA